MSANEYVATRLKSLKDAESLTNEQLAERIGVAESTIYRWLSGDIGKNNERLIDLIISDPRVSPIGATISS